VIVRYFPGRVVTCGALGVDAELVDLARDGRLYKESVSGRSEPSKRWRDGGTPSFDLLSRSTRRGGSLCTSEAPEPPGAVWERVARWSSRTGRAADREHELTFFSYAAGSRRRDDVTSTARGGERVDDPDMSLQSTAALGSSSLHAGSGDVSSLEETSCSPAFHCLMRLSYRSCLAISHSLCCALRATRRLSAVALFQLKIASYGSGALAGTRCAHFNYENKEWTSQQSSEVSEKTDSKPKKLRSMKNLSEEATTYQFLGPLVGEHRKKTRRRPHIGRLLDHLRHTTLDLVRRREDWRSHSPCPGARSAIISQRRSGRLRRGTPPRAWYWPMMVPKVTPYPRRHPSTA
jgi:hypothetical protein